MKEYNPQKIEKKWQRYWEKNKTYKNYKKKDKFYCLDMFPYPSGAGLHVGHPRGYIATDIVSRYKQMNGMSVFHPIGWDAFGLPAENYAIKNKVHPKKAVSENVNRFKKQLQSFGFTYDWDKEINTTDPEYYKWTQWIFLQLFKKGLAYESNEPINWCPSCKTGLANEDLENGLCERCGSRVEQKPIRQWVLKMTAYADKLLKDLDILDWPEPIIEQQKNWIGRSEGAVIKFSIVPVGKGATLKEEALEVFTTRVDTIFGCTYVVVAPEHKLVSSIKNKVSNWKEINNYVKDTQKKTELERIGGKDLPAGKAGKTGIELTGIKAINPFNGEEVSIFVADYVLGHYGTGAVMAVPAHDERDFEFAKKYGLKIKESISGGDILKQAFVDGGKLVNSSEFTGMTSEKARKEMTKWLAKNKLGSKKVNYKMRDWVFSRQRYWGEPIPIIHCEKCGAVPVPEKDLPVKLPDVKSYEPTGTGESPLAKIDKWVNVKCFKCKGSAKRETNTMPQWAGSSWYYIAYLIKKREKYNWNKKEIEKWLPVDLYVGGVEHATRHLLYARFWHKVLYDIGAVSTKEPFQKLINQGLIMAEDGRKMSKRWGNVINPDEIIKVYGADSLRLYEMFIGPFDQSIPWSTNSLIGTRRFLERVWRLQFKLIDSKKKIPSSIPVIEGKDSRRHILFALDLLLHKTIKKVTEDIEDFKFNTAISQLMILMNEIDKSDELGIKNYEILLVLLSPFAPHISEELWENLGSASAKASADKHKKSIFLQKWPKPDLKKIKDETFELVVQINGKVRDKFEAPVGIAEEKAKQLTLERENVKKYISEKTVHKLIFVPNKLINIVIK